MGITLSATSMYITPGRSDTCLSEPHGIRALIMLPAHAPVLTPSPDSESESNPPETVMNALTNRASDNGAFRRDRTDPSTIFADGDIFVCGTSAAGADTADAATTADNINF